jgi:hypothetical protein
MANNVGNLNSFACQALPHRIIPLHAPLSPFSSSSRHSECRVSRHRFTSSYGTGKGERGQAKKGNVRMRVTQTKFEATDNIVGDFIRAPGRINKCHLYVSGPPTKHKIDPNWGHMGWYPTFPKKAGDGWILSNLICVKQSWKIVEIVIKFH